LRKYLILFALLVILLFAGLNARHQSASKSELATASAASAPVIDKQPPTVSTRTFDPSAPPADMPPLAAGEEAQCDTDFISDASVKGRTETIDATHAALTVTSVRVILQLKINVWVPEGATQHVIEHEQGHRQISEHYYETADKVAGEIAAKYLGKQISVDTADPNAEVKNMLKQMSADITAEYNHKLNPDLAQNRYDDLTDHSRNDVSAADAVAEALKDVP